MSTNAIYLTNGNKRYVGGTITEVYGKDISGATFLIATVLNQTDPNIPPAAASFTSVGSDAITIGASGVASKKLLRLIDTISNYPAGVYGCWGRIADNPEIEPVFLQQFTVI